MHAPLVHPLRRAHDRGVPLQATLKGLVPQPMIGGLLFLSGVAAIGLTWGLHAPRVGSRSDLVLLGLLTLTVAGSKLWSIPMGRASRLYVSSVPLYLITCLFAPPLSGLAVGGGMLLRELSICRECENSAGSIGSQVGRWILLSLGVSALVQSWPAAYLGYVLAIAAIMLWAGDVLTCPFVFTPITGMRPARIIVSAARQSYAGELMQYLIGMLTLLCFLTGILWTGALWTDALGTLMVVLPIVLLHLYLKGEDALRAEQAVSPREPAED